MDYIKDDFYYLKRIAADLSFICKHMHEISLSDLANDEVLLDSMMFRLIQISENTKKLTHIFKQKHSTIPWHALHGLRNRIVHDYGNVNLTIIFETLTRDIPNVLELIEKEKDA